MKSKYLLLGIAVLVMGLVVSCNTDKPSFTADQVISRVKIYGIPQKAIRNEIFKLGDSFKKMISGRGSSLDAWVDARVPKDTVVVPVDEWVAAYEGNNQWRVQGNVTTGRGGKFSTIWLHTDTEITLVKVSKIG